MDKTNTHTDQRNIKVKDVKGVEITGVKASFRLNDVVTNELSKKVTSDKVEHLCLSCNKLIKTNVNTVRKALIGLIKDDINHITYNSLLCGNCDGVYNKEVELHPEDEIDKNKLQLASISSIKAFGTDIPTYHKAPELNKLKSAYNVMYKQMRTYHSDESLCKNKYNLSTLDDWVLCERYLPKYRTIELHPLYPWVDRLGIDVDILLNTTMTPENIVNILYEKIKSNQQNLDTNDSDEKALLDFITLYPKFKNNIINTMDTIMQYRVEPKYFIVMCDELMFKAYESLLEKIGRKIFTSKDIKRYNKAKAKRLNKNK